MHIHNYEMSQQRHTDSTSTLSVFLCSYIAQCLDLLHSQYILDSQKLYVYRAVVVALSIVFYNVSNSSLLYGPAAAVRLALAFFNCSVLAT